MLEQGDINLEDSLHLHDCCSFLLRLLVQLLGHGTSTLFQVCYYNLIWFYVFDTVMQVEDEQEWLATHIMET